jgi:hypothetical protein
MTLVGFAVIGILFSPVSFGICLGIFEKKSLCEVGEKYDKDRDICAQLSWRRCEKYDNNEDYMKYNNCIHRMRISCMRNLGHRCTDTADAGSWGDC